MFDIELIERRRVMKGLSYWRLSKEAGVNQRTLMNFLSTGSAHAKVVYKVGRVLGFQIKKNQGQYGAIYDFSSMLKPSHRVKRAS